MFNSFEEVEKTGQLVEGECTLHRYPRTSQRCAIVVDHSGYVKGIQSLVNHIIESKSSTSDLGLLN